ncbi:hypothetical protein [Paraburkholderia tagetis]|uniref:Uncharacterized protein n=1 Tax=Paraburkholderia tagetis TaxID=2913261 RepID=A0A9X1RLC5_9BURK|nr:hypothetical protein [Paraburkholderia tagetis]MCG5071901.1 hypothetical protein [Paraburkholderia tagetis]
MAPQPNDPPETGTPNALPRWLLDTAGGKDGVAQPGGTKKVYRKDMLGYVGKHQDVQHLHFEVFMADADFTAWFDQAGHKVQIGEKDPALNTLKTTDAGEVQIEAVIQASKSTNGNVANQNINGLDHRLQSFVYIKCVLLDLIDGDSSEKISFVWRRNTAQEPVLDASGQPVLDPHTHHPKRKYFPTTYTIQVSLEKQRP